MNDLEIVGLEEFVVIGKEFELGKKIGLSYINDLINKLVEQSIEKNDFWIIFANQQTFLASFGITKRKRSCFAGFQDNIDCITPAYKHKYAIDKQKYIVLEILKGDELVDNMINIQKSKLILKRGHYIYYNKKENKKYWYLPVI